VKSLVGQVWERHAMLNPSTLWLVTKDDEELVELVNLETGAVKETLAVLLTHLPSGASAWRRFA
jgi:hypothetical protein